jgi:hypothetical protein
MHGSARTAKANQQTEWRKLIIFGLPFTASNHPTLGEPYTARVITFWKNIRSLLRIPQQLSNESL